MTIILSQHKTCDGYWLEFICEELLSMFSMLPTSNLKLRGKKMIHTFSISKQVDWIKIRRIVRNFNYSKEEIDNFLLGEPTIKINRFLRPQYLSSRCAGLKKFRAYRYVPGQGQDTQWYISLTIEPRTLIEGVRHINLFEATEENINRLRERFHTAVIRTFFNEIETCDTENVSDLTTWKAKRVDYTYDIHMKSDDDVKFFKNIAKWLARGNLYTQSKYNTYGDNFDEYGLRIGNKSWEFVIYDKHKEVYERFRDITDTVREQLLHESENIARVELRCKDDMLKRIREQQGFDDLCIVNFLSEEISNQYLFGKYEDIIGYEDFSTMYYAEKALKNYLMNKAGKLKKKLYDKYRGFLAGIMKHKGLKNYEIDYVIHQHHSKATFRRLLKFFREKLYISPVLIPDDWRHEPSEKSHGRGLELPANGFKNPIRKPFCD